MARSQPSPITQELSALDDRTERLDVLLSELQRRAFRLASIVARDSSLTFQQFLALAYLGDHGPCAVNDLRSALGIAQSTASELVTRLERGGFVTKERDARDARSLRVELAGKGREAVRKRRRTAREYYRGMLTEKPEAEQTALLGALESLLKSFPNNKADDAE